MGGRGCAGVTKGGRQRSDDVTVWSRGEYRGCPIFDWDLLLPLSGVKTFLECLQTELVWFTDRDAHEPQYIHR